MESWEINEQLAAAITAGQLTLHANAFFRVCAKHLMRTHPKNRTKGHYRTYAEMIVNKYSCLKDRNASCPYVSFLISIFALLIFSKYTFLDYRERKSWQSHTELDSQH